MNKPKILVFDIETAPILGYVWGLWENNVGLNQIHSDWHILSWSAKWYENVNGDVFGPHKKTMYSDQRGRGTKGISNDKNLLRGIWKLLNEADIVITQNGKKFDVKKLNARFVMNGMKPPSSYKHIDTCEIAKRKFGFTSNKLEYLSDKLNKKYKKQKHEKFAGFEMWTACLADNIEAWREMEKYNKYDVLALEELYQVLAPWDGTLNVNIYSDTTDMVCNCGSTQFKRNGYAYTSVGKFQRHACRKCGAEVRNRENVFSKKKKKSIRVRVT